MKQWSVPHDHVFCVWGRSLLDLYRQIAVAKSCYSFSQDTCSRSNLIGAMIYWYQSQGFGLCWSTVPVPYTILSDPAKCLHKVAIAALQCCRLSGINRSWSLTLYCALLGDGSTDVVGPTALLSLDPGDAGVVVPPPMVSAAPVTNTLSSSLAADIAHWDYASAFGWCCACATWKVTRPRPR